MQVSSKVLIDINYKGVVKGDERIIYQREHKFSLETLFLLAKKLVYGDKMKQAAAERIAALCSSAPDSKQLINSIDKEKGITTTHAEEIFMKIELANKFNTFIGKNGNGAIPTELQPIINEKIEAKLSNEINRINTSNELSTNDLHEIKELIEKNTINPTGLKFNPRVLDNINKANLTELNSLFKNEDLLSIKNYLADLKKDINTMADNYYKKKLDASLEKLIVKTDHILTEIIDTDKKAKLELENTQRKNLLDSISCIISKNKLLPELKEISKQDTFNDIAFNAAIFGNEENKEIREFLIPLSHYFKFGSIVINKTSAPILQHLLSNKVNFISNIEETLSQKDRINQSANKNIVDVNYTDRFRIRLDFLKKDLAEFNTKPENEKIDQNETLDQINNRIELIDTIRATLNQIRDEAISELTIEECSNFIDCISCSEILKDDKSFITYLNSFIAQFKELEANNPNEEYGIILEAIQGIEESKNELNNL